MFFSLRLAALTLSALSITNNVLGSVIPLVKPFVSSFFFEALVV